MTESFAGVIVTPSSSSQIQAEFTALGSPKMSTSILDIDEQSS
jgi:hypothetical protein